MTALVPAILSVAAGAGAALCVGPASRYMSQRRLARLCAQRRTLVLSYDDGPGLTLTPRILDLLAAHGARASFFALGQQADRNPEVLDRMVREGHEVGCHAYSHVHPWRSLPWKSAQDVSAGMRALAPWMPQGGLFRPPYGKMTPLTWAIVRASGARLAWWTLDSGDTWAELPDAARVVDETRVKDGGVVLMHDFDRIPVRADYVLRLTESLLRLARERGLRVAPIGELFRPAPV